MGSRGWTALGSAVGVSVRHSPAGKVWLRILPVDLAAGLPERLGLACAALLPAVCVLNLMIVAQMGLRARSGAVDPLAGRDDASLQVNQRALTNTVEQLAGFAPALLALAAGVSSDRMRFVVAAGVVFAVCAAGVLGWVSARTDDACARHGGDVRDQYRHAGCRDLGVVAVMHLVAAWHWRA